MKIHTSCHCADCKAAARIAFLVGKHGITKKEYEELRQLSDILRGRTLEKIKDFLTRKGILLNDPA